ncbi:MAG: YihY family inner membrane protein [Bacteroidales bacterium]
MERGNGQNQGVHAHAEALILQARARRFVAFARYAAARYRKDSASRIAAALSYTSLLSLVPLLAIALAMLAAFPVFDDVRSQLIGFAIDNLVPAIGDVVERQINRFIGNAGRLTAAGVVGLAFTAVMLLATIESSFNMIFRVARERTILSKLLVYWTGMTLGPLLIGAAFSLQGYMTAVNKWAVTQAVSPFLSLPVPFLLTVVAFTGMFAAIPNRRVQLRDALAGAVVAALLFAGLRWGFGIYVTSSKAYTSLYGAVAAVPIFLFWMFLSWVVVLMGAEVTAALPEWRAGYHEAETRARGARRLTLALDVLAQLLKGLQENSKGVARRDLLEATAVAEHDLAPVLRKLCAAGFAAPLAGSRYLLARDLDTATLDDLIVALELELALDNAIAAGSPWRARIEPLIDAARESHRTALNIPLKPLLAQGI